VSPAGFTKVSALGVEEQRVDVLIDIESPPERWAALGDAYRVEVRVVVADLPDAVLVPTGALFRQGEGWAVFRVESGRARVVPVRLGRRTPAHAEVLEGLGVGDAVIVHPPDTLDTGEAVRARGAGEAGR
jgi:HlyD family secretion protein